jgi:phosphoglycolate phosphatase
VIFDLDGTLANTASDIASALNHVLTRHGFRAHAEQSVLQMVGDGAEALIERASPGARPELQATMLAEYRSHYLEHVVGATRPYPGVEELLGELEARKVPLGVLSNKPDSAARALVQALFPAVRFVAVWGHRPGKRMKPDPAEALALASVLGVEPSACLLVGDSGVDMLTASAAGMKPVGALWGFRGRDELMRHGAAALLERPRELLEVLAGLEATSR